jgi:hypothetical protein
MKLSKKVLLPLVVVAAMGMTGCKGATSDSSTTSTSTTSTQPEGAAATGAFSYVASSYDERAKITDQLESYAIKNHLTGIPVFDDGGASLYSSRLSFPTTKNVDGYGTGLLREGNITDNTIVDTSTNTAWKWYLHTLETTDQHSLNELDDDGSVIADLATYFKSGFYAQRLKKDSTGAYTNNYEWYGSYAKEKPVAVNRDSATKLASTWKIYVKTGDDGLVFRNGSSNSKYNAYDKKGVTLDDYIFALKILLTKKVGYYRQSQYTNGSSTIKGASAYYNASGDGYSSDAAKKAWANVGYTSGTDSTGSYIQLTYATPCNDFYAMYYCSDTLLSPINQDFYETVCGKDTDSGFNPNAYGHFSTDLSLTPVDTTLSCGPYMIEQYDSDADLVFKKDDKWVELKDEPNIYRIKGVKITFDSAMGDDESEQIKQFIANKTDSTGIPSDYWDTYKDDIRRRDSNGTTSYKLNINSCSQDRWNTLFGTNGTITQTADDEAWTCKPIMQNSKFLDGCYVAIDRETVAATVHRNPCDSFLTDAYLYDPENGVSYNSTTYHTDAIADYYPDTYCYNKEAAITLFKEAGQELINAGSYKYGDTITLSAYWQTAGQVKQFGNTVTSYIVDDFNTACKSIGLTLAIDNLYGAHWYDVYYSHLMVGQFDFGFGSVSGNTLDPVSFFEVLKDDNSSGFTLNWGTDTTVASTDISYDHRTWSFSGLWQAINTGTIVKDGAVVIPFIYKPSDSGISEDGSTITLKYSVDTDVTTSANMVVEGATLYTSDFDDTVSGDFITVDAATAGELTITIDVAGFADALSTDFSTDMTDSVNAMVADIKAGNTHFFRATISVSLEVNNVPSGTSFQVQSNI